MIRPQYSYIKISILVTDSTPVWEWQINVATIKNICLEIYLCISYSFIYKVSYFTNILTLILINININWHIN